MANVRVAKPRRSSFSARGGLCESFSEVFRVAAHLTGAKLRDFKALARLKADDIVRRWVDFHVLGKHNDPERITRKLK